MPEAIYIATNLIIENRLDIKFAKRLQRKLSGIATSRTYFTNNVSMFDQIDGVAMGSPLASVVANLFIGFHEQNWIEQATNVKPIFTRGMWMIFLSFLSLSQMLVRFIVI